MAVITPHPPGTGRRRRRVRGSGRRRLRRLAALSTAVGLVAASCAAEPAAGPAPGDDPASELAFAEGRATATTDPTATRDVTATTEPRPRPPTTLPPPIAHGTPEQPFIPLPPTATATAVVTPTGVVLPVVFDRRATTGEASWVALTPCGDARIVSDLEPLGRAHVVLDPGHGGREFGSVGPAGVVEKDLNLAVALAAETMLADAGASVILTRSTDVAMTTGVRAALARTVRPALFVSIHHNGGAPATGDRPGTIVFTKSQSEASTRFGGLFHQALTPGLIEIANAKQEEFRHYAIVFAAHEAAIADYDRSLAARDAALVANGQIAPTATTLPPPAPLEGRERIDGTEVPSTREPVTTTTMPVPDDRTTVVVPDTVPLPSPPDLVRVPEFRWAGSGNAGVRSWLADDGRDLLSVLRRSGDVPAVLVEYLYVTNPVEEALLADPAFVELEARALTVAILRFLSTDDEGTGFVADQVGDQNIGGGGRATDCREPELGLGQTAG
ncbi:MAG: N-acetylmuramoyl-L-alanine amidase [Acidimicrobiia bacterium]|nr:N-acetylmuramoyl-L-alanine amidase [Acidimicrobiia bacterium]